MFIDTRRYDASYYGYLWSKVFAADLFSQFESNILSPELGKKYRDIILARGGSRYVIHPPHTLVHSTLMITLVLILLRDGADMLRDFLGRDPTIEPFFKEIGL
jgi:thimet oligopeptidase